MIVYNDMQLRLKKKISSRTGASITFALLLFLVCAVVSSVILVAGTAASGRMAQLAEMDQRYYSVTSAAEFLSKKFDGKTITVIKRRYLEGEPDTEYLVYSGAEAPKKVTGSGASLTFENYGENNTLLKEAALHVIMNNPTSNTTKDLKLTGSDEHDRLKQADVSFIVETITPGGEIKLDIVKDGYRLRLTFSVATSKRTESSPESSERDYIDDVTEFSWQLKGIETITSEGSS